MAAVEKIYGNKAQFFELYNWCKNHCKKALKHFYMNSVWGVDLEEQKVIALFPYEIDMFLYDNCDLEWVKEKIENMYDIKE